MPTGGIVEIEEEIETASQADTEPLAFENDEEEIEEVNREEESHVMDQEEMKAEMGNDADEVEEMNIQDTDMMDGEVRIAEENESFQQDADELSASQVTGNDVLSPSKSGQGGTNFSDESDLTDEPDDDDEEEQDDDNIGEEGDEDGDSEDDEDEDDEDEAAEGLAALTDGQTSSNSVEVASGNGTVGSGLEGLAVIAAAEAEGESSQAEDDTDNDSIAESITRGKGRRVQAAIPRRTTTRLNEMMVASPAMSEDEDEDEEDDDEMNRINRVPVKKGNREMSSLLGLSSAAKKNTKSGATGGLLAGAPSITIEGAASAVASTATSRAGSAKLDEEEGEEEDEEEEEEEDEINATNIREEEIVKSENDGQEAEDAGTPAQENDEAGAEDETTTDEAALRRQEAMEALTKIEIGFAYLRDKLYVERMEEVSKEGEMILEGTHPDLVHLTNLIEIRREKKLSLVDKWFEQQEKQYERVAMTEEAAAWNNWRNEVVELRRQELFNVARKRRRLDREKRIIDVPRPARRHQIFETELIRNPDYDRKNQIFQQGNSKIKIRKEGDMDEMSAYVAFPDLRSAEEGEAWMDMERMGIAGDARMIHAMGSAGPFFRPDEMPIDPYAVYVMEQQQEQQNSHASLPSAAGTSSTFITHGPGQASEFTASAYERPIEGRANQSFSVDPYGRPLSPLPAQPQQHSQTTIPSGHRNTGHRAHEVYNDHTHPHSKGQNQRSPPMPASTDRDIKAVNTRIGGPYSPPPQPLRHADHSRNSQFVRYDDATHRSVKNNSGYSRPQQTIQNNPAAAISRSESATDTGPSFGNHRHQEHLYSR